ncbi:MAG: hypothetical protein HUU06_07760, partial [Planctomycetaceae bacterium]|nr:hypothetical protein [Planctomycetaceae bacterium]
TLDTPAAGVRAAVEARREFPGAESGFFDFRGLRHLSMVEALAYDRFAVTQDPLGPGAVDRTDDLAELKAFALRFRNRLQAERGGRRVDWIDLEVRAHWFPGGLDPAASPLRFKEEGLEEARFSDFRGEEKYRGSPLRGEWGPYEGDLRVWARENLYLLGEAEYDPYEGVTRTSAVGARWFVIPKASLYAGNRRIAGDSNIYTLAADWAVSEKWLLHLSQQTDFRRDEGLRTEFGFRRVWHDFVLEFDVEYDGLQDDFSLRFSLVPSFLWESPTARKDLPKLDYEARRWYR